jgi:hypothetical protein
MKDDNGICITGCVITIGKFSILKKYVAKLEPISLISSTVLFQDAVFSLIFTGKVGFTFYS